MTGGVGDEEAAGAAWTDQFEEIIRKVAGRTNSERDVDTMVAVMQIVRTANRISQEVDSKVHRPLGFSTAGFRVMSAIYMDGPAEPARLARIAGVSQASISSVLNTLENGGFVTRDRCLADRRVVTVTLTDDGVQACRTATVGQLAVEREWLALADRPRGRRPADHLRKVLTGRHHPADSGPRTPPPSRSKEAP